MIAAMKGCLQCRALSSKDKLLLREMAAAEGRAYFVLILCEN